MKKYEILEHKADLKIRAFGKTKEELFLNMLLGMTNGLRPEIKNKKSKTKLSFMKAKVKKRTNSSSPIKKIKVKSLNSETLLVDFLSEVLYLIQVNREIYNDIKFKKCTNTEIEGKLLGQKVERFGEDIKAVTYHGLEIRRRKDGTREATVLFDI